MKNIRMGLTVVVVLAVMFLNGCLSVVTNKQRTKADIMYWDNIKYNENVTVVTNPPGAEVYVGGELPTTCYGESPVAVVLIGTPFRVTKAGTYEEFYRGNNYGEIPNSRRRLSETVWKEGFEVSGVGGAWVIRASKEGYKPMEVVVHYGKTDGFQKAINSIKVFGNNQIHNLFTDRSSIEMVLEPIPGYVAKTTDADAKVDVQDVK